MIDEGSQASCELIGQRVAAAGEGLKTEPWQLCAHARYTVTYCVEVLPKEQLPKA